jgi:SAM-dependent methyltransferase
MESVLTQKAVIHPEYGYCLDAGSNIGPKRPAQGFSAYCDIVVPKPGDITPPNYHVAPLEDMSCFVDKEFDWVRCHHAIEHCMDPDKACSELQRVGKAGIISFPPPQAEMMFGRRDHRWYVFVDRGRLLFINKWHPSKGIPRVVTRCELNVDFRWEGSFDWQVVHVEESQPC